MCKQINNNLNNNGGSKMVSKKIFKKSIFFVLLAVFVGLATSSQSLFGMKPESGKKFIEEKLTLQAFNTRFADAISRGIYTIEELNRLRRNLQEIVVKKGSEDQAIKNSLLELINKQVLIKSKEVKPVKKVAPKRPLKSTSKPIIKTGPGSVNNYGNNSAVRVNVLLEWARTNNSLIGQSKIVVNGITNNVYQLKVDSQIPSGENTCGPRALFNCYTLSRYFYGPNKNQDLGVQMLDKLINKLRVKAALPVDSFLKEVGELIVKKPPVDLHSGDIETVIIDYKKDDRNKEFFMFKNVSVIESYDHIDLIEGLKELLLKNNFNYHGFVITEGQVERETINLESIGHWIGFFVVKTGVKEYAWFIVDSLNSKHINGTSIDSRIIAYIYKLLGSEYGVYKNIMEKKLKKVGDMEQKIEKVLEKIRPIVKKLLAFDDYTDSVASLLDKEIFEIEKLISELNKIDYFETNDVLVKRFGFNFDNDLLAQMCLDLLLFRKYKKEDIAQSNSEDEVKNILEVLTRLKDGDYSSDDEANKFTGSKINAKYGQLIDVLTGVAQARAKELEIIRIAEEKRKQELKKRQELLKKQQEQKKQQELKNKK